MSSAVNIDLPPRSPSPAKKHPLPKPKQSVTTTEITQLRSLQRSAVAALDIDAAEDIEGQIINLSAEAFAAAVVQLKERMYANVRSLILWHKTNIDTLRNTEYTKTVDLRTHINAEFEALKAKHLQDLVSLETEFASVRMKDSQRTIPEYEEILAQAKAAAAIRDWEQARLLQTAAATAAQTEMDKRLAKLDTDFRGQSESLLQTHQKDLEFLVKKLFSGLDLLKGQAQRSVDTEMELNEARLLSALNKSSKELVVITPLGTDAAPYIRELENDLVALLREAELAVPKKLRWNPKTATRNSLKASRKAKA
jgi:hypothetical protein